MKDKLLKIIGSGEPDETKAEQIIALATVEDGPRHDTAELLGDELTALRSVYEAISRCEPNEVSLTPKLFYLLALALGARGLEFGKAEARAIFG